MSLDTIDWVLLFGCVGVGYLLKGMTGFAEAIPLASFGPLVMPIPMVVSLIAVLDVLGSVGAVRFLTDDPFSRYERLLSVPLVVGVSLGVAVLAFAPQPVLTTVFLAVLVSCAGWLFVVQRAQPSTGRIARADLGTPQVGTLDVAGISLAGFTGGCSGIDGPPLVGVLLTRFRQHDYRAVLMRLLLVSALFRLLLMGLSGQVTVQAASVAAIALVPAMSAFSIGRRLSVTWSMTTTRRLAIVMLVVGVILVAVTRLTGWEQ